MVTDCSINFEGRSSRIYIDDPTDYVQRCAVAGTFYEIEQLIFHRHLILNGATVVDVGSNVGNHTLFYAHHCKTKKVIAFEPSPRAINLLTKTVKDSPQRAKIDISFLPIAISDHDGWVQLGEAPSLNLGATRITNVVDRAAPELLNSNIVRCAPIDQLIGEERIDFIKIDVEGHELKVLKGAENLIRRDRPAIAIEVNRENEPRFWAWVSEKNYRCIMAFFDYYGVKNYILVPS